MGTYFHRTDHAEAILADGFRDTTGSHLFVDLVLTGVGISDRPLDANGGAGGESLLAVDLDADLSEWEVVEDRKPYREWCVPAEVLNRGRVRLAAEDDD
jgi:hypothetical protein